MSSKAIDLEFSVHIDAKGLNCPLPILKSKFALAKMDAGEILFVEATDPHSKIDFEAYCARTGHEILRIDEKKGVFSFYLKRTSNPKSI